MTSLFTFLLVSIEDVAVYINWVQKLKELVNLYSLCKFQHFAISNKKKNNNN